MSWKELNRTDWATEDFGPREFENGGPRLVSFSLTLSNGISLTISRRSDGRNYDLTATGFPEVYKERLEELRITMGAPRHHTMEYIFRKIMSHLNPLCRQTDIDRKYIRVSGPGGNRCYLPGKDTLDDLLDTTWKREGLRIFNADGEELAYLPGIEDPELPK